MNYGHRIYLHWCIEMLFGNVIYPESVMTQKRVAVSTSFLEVMSMLIFV